MISSLIVALIAWGIFILITKQKNIFKKPEDVGKRPRWLFALLFSLAFYLAFAIPLSGSVTSYNSEDKLILKVVFFLVYSSLSVLGYFLYKLVIKMNSNKQKKSAAEDAAIEQTSPPPDEALYLNATEEVESGNQIPALWAKAMAICEGDEHKAKYKYINMRVQDLINEKDNRKHTPEAIMEIVHPQKDTTQSANEQAQASKDNINRLFDNAQRDVEKAVLSEFNKKPTKP